MPKRLIICLALAFGLLPAAAASARVKRWGSYFGAAAYQQSIPSQVFGQQEAIAVEPSNSSTYFLDADGTVWAEGAGAAGQLGDGATENSPLGPVEVAIPEGVDIVALGQARNEGVAITATGEVWGWGENGERSLCLKGGVHPTPEPIPGLSDVVEAAGHAYGIEFRLKNGTVAYCGAGAASGRGSNAGKVSTPTAIPGLTNITKISFDSALTGTGEAYRWGNNENGQVCVGAEVPAVYTPTLVMTGVEQISTDSDVNGNGLTLALIKGELWGCGDDETGEVGDDSTVDKYLPVDTHLKFVQVAAGAEFALGLDSAGNVWGWGTEAHGSLGTGTDYNIMMKPFKIDTGARYVAATAENSVDLDGPAPG
jgi:alpha-tubulin suppressor-like RCC1 family protein